MSPHKIYAVSVGVVFAAVAVVFLTFPRSRYSELEKRELTPMPSLTEVRPDSLPARMSAWFSDTEPYRDVLMAASMQVKSALRMNFGSDEEAVSYHAAATSPATGAGAGVPGVPSAAQEGAAAGDEVAKMANHGIIVIGKGDKVRAVMAFQGRGGGEKFAATVNRYARELGVNTYALVAPLASEFYTPEVARNATLPQRPLIQSIASRLEGRARSVDAWSALNAHTSEDIYLRTDHHWAPLGAFYAAQAFAQSAGVPFRSLDAYDRRVVKGFVGTMYGYSKDAAIKNAPEDFVYYVPNGVDYTTTYRTYTIGEDYRTSRQSAPQRGPFFYHVKDGSGAAYSTFMGSDKRLTKVKTSTGNGRRLLIIKDSYGNALPGFLFYSFEEVHVVDFRYFPDNIRKYAHDNGITDVLFAVNTFNAFSGSVADKMLRLLTQANGSYSAGNAPSAPSPAPPAAEHPSPAATHHQESAPPAESALPAEENAEGM